MAENAQVTKQIRQKIENFRSDGHLSVSGIDIASKQVLPDLYERRSYRAAWTDQERIDDLIQMVGRAEDEGLLPQDYHYNDLVLLRNQNSDDASNIANLDILLTFLSPFLHLNYLCLN